MSANKTTPWDPARKLKRGDHVLIEASAGTGKTYQTEQLVVRLVAEQGVAIEKILVITFTNSATADLRGRVRARLVQERTRLRVEGQQDQAVARLDQALQDFDQAPISTIHSFCQRTLEQLSFAADLDPGLEVVGEPRELRQQLVADELATLYSVASVEDLEILDQVGWTRDGLDSVVKRMTGPELPLLQPAPPEGADPVALALACRPSWRQELDRFDQWLKSAEGQAACQGYREEPKKKGNGVTRFPNLTLKTVNGALEKIEQWVQDGGPRKVRYADAAMAWISCDRISQKWNPDAGDPVTEFAGYPLAERLDQLGAAQDRLFGQVLAAFAHTVRPRFAASLREHGLLTYDSMLSMLHDRLQAEGDDGPLARAMGERYEVAIIDEFQDTDAAQWGILQRVFVRGGLQLYAVGDPKQAIYRFRNANLSVYLDAATGAERYRLDANWRSDTPLVQALNTLWDVPGNAFGDQRIAYEEVKWKKRKRVDFSSLKDQDRRAVELRWFDGGLLLEAADKAPSKEAATAAMAQLCAQECRRLLYSKARIADEVGDELVWRALRPGDIAVLTRKHDQGRAVRAALQAHGIPALKSSRAGVTDSEVVPWLLAWLDAVAAPGVESEARRLALSPIIGWTAARLGRALSDSPDPTAAKDRQAWSALLADIGRWAHNWPRRGFARVFEAAQTKHKTLLTVLGSVHGERAATDLRHLCELLQAEERRTRPGPRGLAEWLRRQVVQEQDRDEGELALQLESDASAVKVVTIHASKGLQYPIVMVPFEWASSAPTDRGQPVSFTRATDQGPRLVLDISPKQSADRKLALAQQAAEQRQEDMRLLYVATTRALHHLVLWVAVPTEGEASPAGQLVFAARDSAVVWKKSPSKKKAAVAETDAHNLTVLPGARDTLEALSDASGDTVGWSACKPPEPLPAKPWRPRADQREAELPERLPGVRAWDPERRLGASWIIASYSSLAAGKTSDPDEPTQRNLDLPQAPAPEQAAEGPQDLGTEQGAVLDQALADTSLHQAAAAHDLPGGTRTGDWLHGIFEQLDFSNDGAMAVDGRSAAELVGQLARRHGLRQPRWTEQVLKLLPRWLQTPLDAPFPGGPGLPAGFTLGQLKRADRLDELRFDLRLGAGAGWRPTMRSGQGDYQGRVDPNGVRLALKAALEHPDFGGRGWLADLLTRKTGKGHALRVLPAIAGLLTGFVDLTFRIGGASGQYFICDYKSNQLKGPEALQQWHRELAREEGDDAPRLRRLHYTRPVMAWGMSHAAYHLQALVYTVALHRLLEQRLEGYHYDKHVGGHLYLFLRGMEGAGTPRPRPDDVPLGVWADRWPAATVVGLSAALDGSNPKDVQAAMNKVAGGGR